MYENFLLRIQNAKTRNAASETDKGISERFTISPLSFQSLHIGSDGVMPIGKLISPR